MPASPMAGPPAIGADAIVVLAPEGPQRGDLAEDVAAALAANPAAGAFFDTLAQFYRKAYLRYIDATSRRPDLRAERIAEVAGLLADGIKERPRPTDRPPALKVLPGKEPDHGRTSCHSIAAGAASRASLRGASRQPGSRRGPSGLGVFRFPARTRVAVLREPGCPSGRLRIGRDDDAQGTDQG